jgi:hypothetical protein
MSLLGNAARAIRDIVDAIAPDTRNSAGDPPGQGVDYDDPEWTAARERAGVFTGSFDQNSSSGWTK